MMAGPDRNAAALYALGQHQHAQEQLRQGRRDFSDIRVGNNGDEDEDDTGSFYARSIAEGDPTGARRRIASGGRSQGEEILGIESEDEIWDEALRPESLALHSPLDQLTRKLSYTGTRSGIAERNMSSSLGIGRPPVHRGISNTSNTSAGSDSKGKTRASDAYGIASYYGTTADARQPSNVPGQEQLPLHSRQASGSSGPQAFNESYTEPVRFSRTSSAYDNDNSDAQSQLINAFRNSYSTQLTGGVRDSTYSWMNDDYVEEDGHGSKADSRYMSTNGTLDFKTAAGKMGRDSDVGAYGSGHDGTGGRSRKASHGRGPSGPSGSTSSTSALRVNIVKSTATGFSEWGNESTHEPEDAERTRKARARVSSWDSTVAKDMGLDRRPSTRNHAEMPIVKADGRSADPRQRSESRSSTEGATRNSSSTAETKTGSASGQGKGKGKASERESNMSGTDPFHYAAYESEPSSADDHNKLEELDIRAGGGTAGLSSKMSHLNVGSSVMQPSDSLREMMMDTQRVSQELDKEQDEGSRTRQQSNTSNGSQGYVYPLTPPQHYDQQHRTSDEQRYADAAAGSSSTESTPIAPGATAAAHRVKSQVPYSNPYHRRFQGSTASAQPQPKAANQQQQLVPDLAGGAGAADGHASHYSTGTSVYPDTAQVSPQWPQAGYPDYPPMPAQNGQLAYGQQGTSLQAPYDYSSAPTRPRRPDSPTELSGAYDQHALYPPNTSDLTYTTSPSQNTPRSVSNPLQSNTRPAVSTPQSYRNFSDPASAAGSRGLVGPSTPQSQTREIGKYADGQMIRSDSGHSVTPTSGPDARRGDKAVNRSPSQVLASAISKHRAHREAQGLSTEGEYYVDPKTKKHYFVPSSGSGAGGGSGEKKKDKGRRKLHKKESTWEVTKIKPSESAEGIQMMPVRGADQAHGYASHPMAGYAESVMMGTSYSGSESGDMARRWNASANGGSRAHTPLSSPQINQGGIRVVRPPYTGSSLADNDDQEYIWEQHNARPPFAPGIDDSPSARSIGSSRGGDAYGGMSNDSPAGRNIPTFETTNYGPSPADQQPSHQHQGSLSVPSQGPQSHAMTHNKSGSLYSNYSYYGMPENDRSYSREGTPESSPATHQGAWPSQSGEQDLARSMSPGRGATPEIEAREQDNVPNLSTMGKTKASIARHPSLLLLNNNHLKAGDKLTVPKAGHGPNPNAPLDLAGLSADDSVVCLHLGIDAHERGEMERSASLFKKSATQECGLGMLMYGLSLRHGWGCPPDPVKGFEYIRKAAESVVGNLDRVIKGEIQLSEQQLEEQAAKSELVLSIYELGQCFLRGWGVTKDKKAALSYFELAANLGDPDAQSELGFCYSQGRGCKKDLKKAAKYYRLAAAQGQTTYGMQWIYKSKYAD